MQVADSFSRELRGEVKRNPRSFEIIGSVAF
jgi:hypothetical protein